MPCKLWDVCTAMFLRFLCEFSVSGGPRVVRVPLPPAPHEEGPLAEISFKEKIKQHNAGGGGVRVSERGS